jgi:hypothetical protein
MERTGVRWSDVPGAFKATAASPEPPPAAPSAVPPQAPPQPASAEDAPGREEAHP